MSVKMSKSNLTELLWLRMPEENERICILACLNSKYDLIFYESTASNVKEKYSPPG